MPSQPQNRSRGFIFTNFDVVGADYEKKMGKQVRYLAYGGEVCPETSLKKISALHNAPKTGLDAPLRIPELARARPSLRCAPFKYFWCMGRIRCGTIYSFFGAEEMDFGLSEISNVEIRF
jgi:hypothetical protein